MFRPSEEPGTFDADNKIADAPPALRSIFNKMIPFIAACAAEPSKARSPASGGGVVSITCLW